MQQFIYNFRYWYYLIYYLIHEIRKKKYIEIYYKVEIVTKLRFKITCCTVKQCVCRDVFMM